MKVILTIPFEPVPWAAPKLSKYRCYDPKESDKRAIRYLIQAQYKGEPYDKYVALLFQFYFKVPASASKKQQAKMLNNEILPTKCDCTNLQKLYEDCLKKIVITDDRNVGVISSYKCYAPQEGVEIMVQDYYEYFEEHEHINRRD